ncbi:hypothetical protein [Blastococcus sp. SYSU D00820]
MNRALRAATMGILIACPVALTACSAGQVTQTASQDRDKVGPSYEVGDLTLRQVLLAYPGEEAKEDDPATEGVDESTFYADGDDPELLLTIVNGGREDDTLVGITGEVFDGVFLDEAPQPAPATPTTTAPTTPAAPGTEAPATGAPGSTPGSEAGEAGEDETGTGTGAGTTPVPPAAPATAAPTPTTRLSVPVPAGDATFIGPRVGWDGEVVADDDDLVRVFLADLDLGDERLTVGQTLTLTLQFQRAGEVEIQVLVAGPNEALERGEGFDFHEEEGAEQGDEPGTEAE